MSIKKPLAGLCYFVVAFLARGFLSTTGFSAAGFFARDFLGLAGLSACEAHSSGESECRPTQNPV